MSNVKKMSVPFAQVPNELLYSENISLKAKGLWAYMQAKPLDWNFASERIAKETKESSKAILSAVTELVDNGWLSKTKLSNGRLEYELFEKPEPQNGCQPKGQTAEIGCISNKEINKERDITKKDITANAEEESLPPFQEEKKVSGGDINAVVLYFYKAMAPAALGNAIKNKTIRGAAEGLLTSYSPTEIRNVIDKNKAMKEGFGKCYSLTQFTERFEAIKNTQGISRQVFRNLDEE